MIEKDWIKKRRTELYCRHQTALLERPHYTSTKTLLRVSVLHVIIELTLCDGYLM